ncbi:MAG: hypothetical protein LKI76_04330 [Megasphaera sp.]|nr:hypothetical protein [Megasphaera sp.]
MDNLFAYLGEWGNVDTLMLKNPKISKILDTILPEYMDILEGLSFNQYINGAQTSENVADAVFSYFKDSILTEYMPNNTGLSMYDSLTALMPMIKIDPAENLWKLFSEDLNQIRDVIFDEIKYVMIMSYVYTQTLYSPRVGTEHPITKYYNIGGRTLSSKAQYYTGNKAKYHHSLLQSMIYRNCDKKRRSVVQSALDFGIVLGLVTATTTKHNPYIKKEGTDKIQIPLTNIKKFLNGFQHAPISEEAAANVVAANQYLQRKTSSQYIMLFNQCAVERFTNVNYLINAFDFTNTINQTYCNYFETLFKLLMIFPLPKTRLVIVQCIKRFVLQKEKEDNPNNNLKRLLDDYLPSLARRLEDTIIKLMEIALPVLVLAFHYAMHQYTKKNGEVTFGFTEYFQHLQELRCYEYVKVQKNGELDTTEKVYQLCKEEYPNETIPLPQPYQLCDMDPERYNRFVKFAGPYYQAFINKTNEYAENRNFCKRFYDKLPETHALYFQILSDIMLGIVKTEGEYMPRKTLGIIKK